MEGRTARSCAVLAVVAAMLVACTAGAEESGHPADTPAPSVSGSGNDASERRAREPRDFTRLLEPAAASEVRGWIAEPYGITRARNGTALVVWHPPNNLEQIFYRTYDREWTPVSRLFEVQVGLDVVRGLRSSFLAHATLYNRAGMRKMLDEWVIVSASGRIRRVGAEPGVHRLEPGDLRARTSFDHKWAFRPDLDSVIRIALRPWESATTPYVDDDGAVCVVPRGTRSGGPVFASLDDGLHWRQVETSAISAMEGSTRVQSCSVAAERVVVMTGGEYPEHISVLDRLSGAVVSRIRLGDRLGDSPFSGYGWQQLPDGRLVFDARRPGLMVATDASNQEFEFRPGPPGLAVDVIDGDLVDAVAARRSVLVSEDGGRIWSRVDLSLPSAE